MAGGAGLVAAMLAELLANRDRAPGCPARRRARRREAERAVRPAICFITHAPRFTGEVVVPLAVTLKTLACVRNPPRWLSGGNGTLRNAEPDTPGMR